MNYATNWKDTLGIVIGGTIILYFMSVGQVGVWRTLGILVLVDLGLSPFLYENIKFRYLKIENKQLITRNGYFSAHTVISIVALQGIRALQRLRYNQPDLLIPDGSHQKLVLNAYVYHDSLPKFLSDVQQMMPHIELDDVCRKAIEKGKWPLLPVKISS
jgi:hypothetical protein